MEILQQGLALVVVFGLLGGSLWFVKSRQNPNFRLSIPGGPPRKERRMQVVERIALTPQHTLCLVKVGGRMVMIGTAPSSCQLIDSLEDVAE